MAVTEVRGEPTPATSAPTLADAPPSAPIKLWATVGAVWLTFEAWVVGRWILSGPQRTPTGPDDVPTWMQVAGHTWEILGLFAWAAFVYWFLIRPWRRDGRISTDGLLVIVFQLMYFHDVLYVYASPWSSYNSMFWNFGSWLDFVPGAMNQHGGRFAEPILWTGPIYVYLVLGSVMVANKGMRWAQERFKLSNYRLVAYTYVFFIFLDVLLEGFLVLRLGIYSFNGAIDGWSIASGTYYQFPVYEALLWGACWTTFAMIRYFRDDKGLTVAERGVEHIHRPPRTRTLIRFMALMGACNAAFFFVYDVPINIFALNADQWPTTFESRSYLRDGFCGEGTTYACPGPNVPLNRGDRNVHVGEDGLLVTPEGTDPVEGFNYRG